MGARSTADFSDEKGSGAWEGSAIVCTRPVYSSAGLIWVVVVPLIVVMAPFVVSAMLAHPFHAILCGFVSILESVAILIAHGPRDRRMAIVVGIVIVHVAMVLEVEARGIDAIMETPAADVIKVVRRGVPSAIVVTIWVLAVSRLLLRIALPLRVSLLLWVSLLLRVPLLVLRIALLLLRVALLLLWVALLWRCGIALAVLRSKGTADEREDQNRSRECKELFHNHLTG